MKKYLTMLSLSIFILPALAVETKVEKDIQACNFITQYLCLLEDFEGKGYMRVRKELQENVNKRNLLPQTRKLLRRLEDACDLAESTLQNIEYTTEDSSDNSIVKWGENLGFTGVASIVLGDPTPLIYGVSKSLLDQHNIDKEKRRAIDIQLRTFNQMLNRYHVELNDLRSDIIEEYNVPNNLFVTRSEYQEFVKAANKKNDKGIDVLRRMTLSHPQFREAWYFYGEKLQAQKKYDDAYAAYQTAVNIKNLIVRNDGLRSKALTEMGICKAFTRNSDEAVSLLNEAIKGAPEYFRAHYFLSLIYFYQQRQYDKSLEHIERGLQIRPRNAMLLVLKADVFLLLNRPEEEVWKEISKALKMGIGPEKFRDKNVSVAMRDLMNKEESIIKTRPTLTAKIDYGVWDDDVILANASSYPLTNINFSVEISGKYADFTENNGKTRHVGKIDRLDAGKYTKLTDAFSIKNDAAVNIKIAFTADQFPGTWTWDSATDSYTHTK